MRHKKTHRALSYMRIARAIAKFGKGRERSVACESDAAYEIAADAAMDAQADAWNIKMAGR